MKEGRLAASLVWPSLREGRLALLQRRHRGVESLLGTTLRELGLELLDAELEPADLLREAEVGAEAYVTEERLGHDVWTSEG